MGAGLWPQGAALGACGWLCVGLCDWRWLGRYFGGLVVVMTKDEALRLALEALYNLSHYADTCELFLKETHPGKADALRQRVTKSIDAITAIKAALEAKDEPVAWRDAAIRLGEELSSVGPDGYYDMDAKEWLDWAIEQNPRGKHSLPQRTWVGLTDEEKSDIWCVVTGREFVTEDTHVYADAIEAKLKEKNT